MGCLIRVGSFHNHYHHLYNYQYSAFYYYATNVGVIMLRTFNVILEVGPTFHMFLFFSNIMVSGTSGYPRLFQIPTCFRNFRLPPDNSNVLFFVKYHDFLDFPGTPHFFKYQRFPEKKTNRITNGLPQTSHICKQIHQFFNPLWGAFINPSWELSSSLSSSL